MYNTSTQIANYFIKKSLATGKELSPMKLIKLSYIAHGWHLALYNGEPLLDEAIYAWKYGPVIHSLYHNFKAYGKGQITNLYYDGTDYPFPENHKDDFLNKIWDTYSNYDGIALSAMTHQPGTPWDITWKKCGGANDVIIPNDLIQKHYEEKIEEINAKRTPILA